MRFALKCIESMLDRYVHAVAKDGRAALAAYNALFDELERGEAEKDELRADIKEAMTLLQAHGAAPTWLGPNKAKEWMSRWGKLLAKHKEDA